MEADGVGENGEIRRGGERALKDLKRHRGGFDPRQAIENKRQRRRRHELNACTDEEHPSSTKGFEPNRDKERDEKPHKRQTSRHARRSNGRVPSHFEHVLHKIRQ